MSRQEEHAIPLNGAEEYVNPSTTDGAEKQNEMHDATAKEALASHAGRANIKKRKPWPGKCVWPEPIWDGEGDMEWDPDDAEALPVDPEIEELVSIREYMDGLVEEGILNEDYSLNLEYEPEIDEEQEVEDRDFEHVISHDDRIEPPDSDADDGDDEMQLPFDIREFEPDQGEDYWDDGFDIVTWQEDFDHHMNSLKLTLPDINSDEYPVSFIQNLIGYDFVNENLLRQAFTRRAFAIEYGLRADSETLEFLGDAMMGTAVTRVIIEQLTESYTYEPDAPFRTRYSYDEGDFSRLKAQFVSKEYLAQRARTLELDRYILYGTGETATDSAAEDMMEALIGAVTIDSDWNQDAIETVVDRLLCIQLTEPNEYLKKTYYDIFNAWHQRHFGRMPAYEVYDRNHPKAIFETYHCVVRFSVPENRKGIHTAQLITAEGRTRSRAREMAAELACRFIRQAGLWMRLEDAHVTPDLDNSINQLQELYQKKYIDQPVYSFTECREGWYCGCLCNDLHGYGMAGSKTAAKKKASYMVLVLLLKSAGLCEEEWENRMYRTLRE